MRILIAGVVLVLGPRSAFPGTASVEGRVEFRGLRRLPAYHENIYAYRAPAVPRRADTTRRAVVYLEDVEGRLKPSPARPAAIDQRNETFVPTALAVQKGTRVEFPNSDSIYHNVFSFSKVKRFDLGRYPRGESRSVLFDREGMVRVFCEIHSHMSAFVLVLPHSYFTTTDDAGFYRIAGIPAGRYRVVAWNEQFHPVRHEVELADGEALRLDLIVERDR